ncbi:MAG: PH domain-containing protein [Pseudomonadota bacterium]
MFDFKNASPEDLQAEYQKIADEMGEDQFLTKKELSFLPATLMAWEQVLGFTSGQMDGNTWLIVLTDRRIIFLDKGLISGLKQFFIDLDNVQVVSGNTSLFSGKIHITDGSNHRIIENVWKKTIIFMTNKIQAAIELRKNNKYVAPQVSDKDSDPYERLEKLAVLKNKGIISEEEFVREKKKILGI